MGALVDSHTIIWDCTVDRDTLFTGVGLDAASVAPRLKVTLKDNIRQKQWRDWYGEGSFVWRILKNPLVWVFWLISDYGRSTGRILLTFFLLAVAFACVYFHNPTWLKNLNDSGLPVAVLHAVYFSVVTMTTLGFGDIHAKPDVWQGQALLAVQVILGYVLLGALVTRFAVMFSGSGPAAKLSPRRRHKPSGR